MPKYLSCLLIVTVTAWWASQAPVAPANVKWKDDLAVIEWTEPLADPTALPNEVPFSILSGPYLSWLSPNTAAIDWVVIAEKSLSAAPFAALPKNYPDANIKFHTVTLDNLKPDTAYRYRLTTKGPNYTYQSEEFRFRTFPKTGAESFKFAIVGDTQRGELKPEAAVVERKLYALMKEWGPSLMVHMGDNLDAGKGDGIAGMRDWYRVFDRNRSFRTGAFMAPTMGNHCWAGKGRGWFVDYFPQLRSASPKAHPPFFYSFDVANLHFVSLCTEVSKTKNKKDAADEKQNGLPFSYNDQLAWLNDDLAQTKATWKIVYFHKPMHTVGPYPCSDDFRQDHGALFDRHGVQLVLSGHDHSYQKTVRMTNADRKVDDKGSVQLISGGGDTVQFNQKIKADWNTMHKKVNHYVQAEVSGDEIRFRGVSVNGDVFDEWKLKTVGQPEGMGK